MAESEASGDAVEKKSQPQKKYFRQRAHANPLSQWNFDYPMSPDVVPWGDYYPTKCAGVSYADQPKVEMADVGCGYGGLLNSRAELVLKIGVPQDLHLWMAGHLEAHPLFERVSDEELASDPAVPIVMTYTEEGKKVERNQGSKHLAVFRRIAGGSKRKREE